MDNSEDPSTTPISPEGQVAFSAEDFLRKIFFTPGVAREGLALESDPGFRMFLDFLKETSDCFGLNLEAGFAPDRNPEMSGFFSQLSEKQGHINDFDAEVDDLRRTHRFPEGLFPPQQDPQKLFHFAHFLSHFIHFGMYREAEAGRPYFHHTDEVTQMVIRFFEVLSNSFLLLAQLHDVGEDFYHKAALLRKMGLRPDQVHDFRQFLMEYLDRVFPPVEIPSILKPNTQETLPFSEILLLLSKIKNGIPGNHKDRYRDLIEKLYRIFQHSDNNIAAVEFIYYFVIKCCDSVNNFISYAAAQDATMPSAKGGVNRKRLQKERQMRGMTSDFFLPALELMQALFPAYYLRDALRFPNYADRARFAALTEEYREHAGEDSVLAAFKRDFSKSVGEEYARCSGGETLHPDDYELRFWDRAIYPLRKVVAARRRQDARVHAESLSEMETGFFHIVEVSILTPDPRKIPKLQAAIESVFAFMAPHEESTAFPHEREHPLLRSCSISSDRVPHPGKSRIGYVVRHVAPLKYRRRNIGGVLPAMFLNQDYFLVPEFFQFLNYLKTDVSQLRGVLEKIETEFRTLLSLPLELITGRTRSRIAEVFQVSDEQSPVSAPTDSLLQHKGLLGSVFCNSKSLHNYAQALSNLYFFLKEQVLTFLKPKISLKNFVVHIDDEEKEEEEFLSDLLDQPSFVPKGSNALYVLARYFPQHIARPICKITITRGDKVFSSSFSDFSGDANSLQYFTLAENDRVDIWLSEGSMDTFPSSPVINVRDFARSSLYSQDLHDT